MNEIKQTFDYSVVDTNTASFLKLKEQEMHSIVLNSSVQLGEKLIEAQEKLAKYNTGTFEKWFVSLGLKKQTVYNYINQAKFVHQMDESKQIEMFQELPMTLKTEISKPSAEPEAVELVLSGDIKTTKEYRELEKQLKAKDEQIAIQAKMIDDLTEQEPEVVEKKVVVEKIPADYENLKTTNEQLEKQLSSVRNDLKMKKMQYDLLEQNTESAKTLEANIKALQQKEKSIDQRVKATIEFNDLMREIETFFDTKMASLRFKPLINDLYDTEASNKLSEVVNSVDFWVSEMRKIIPNEKTKIIEGEIIDG
ncbi:hypothetical protein ACWOEQ_10835 [Enterococcus asini]|uniref:hypothetical protein n=1 Tax=Enterococcus asini TaxID=57732 RepID=UPI0009000B7C|nr:hypothetical protein [Enterococcus asini]OJG12970.1 hypothetical protein RU94_GL001669 [Enterococcus asini]